MDGYTDIGLMENKDGKNFKTMSDYNVYDKSLTGKTYSLEFINRR